MAGEGWFRFFDFWVFVVHAAVTFGVGEVGEIGEVGAVAYNLRLDSNSSTVIR
jgi:hypothetical protein